MLAVHFGAPFVAEYAREYLTLNGVRYEEKDLLVIAKKQFESGESQERFFPNAKLFIHDTEMITMKIWSREKYDRVDPQIEELVERSHFDHWLLCRPDIQWEADPLRENPYDRDRLFAIYEAELRSMRKPFTIIEGEHEKRMRKAIQVIDGLTDDDPGPDVRDG